MKILYNKNYFSECSALLVDDTGNQLINLAVQSVFAKILPNSEELVKSIDDRIERIAVQRQECISYSDTIFSMPIMYVAFNDGEPLPPRTHQLIIQTTAIERKISDQLLTDHPVAIILHPMEMVNHHTDCSDTRSVTCPRNGDSNLFPLARAGIDKSMYTQCPYVDIL